MADERHSRYVRTASDFYTAFQERNWAGMNACYCSDIVFSDPAFGELHGDEVRMMWRMLCERGKDLRIEFQLKSPPVHPSVVEVHWYSFCPAVFEGCCNLSLGRRITRSRKQERKYTTKSMRL